MVSEFEAQREINGFMDGFLPPAEGEAGWYVKWPLATLVVLIMLVGGLGWEVAHYQRPLNQVELQAVNSMISYVAVQKKSTQEVVRNDFLDRFDVRRVGDLRAWQYDGAIEYLVMRMDCGASKLSCV